MRDNFDKPLDGVETLIGLDAWGKSSGFWLNDGQKVQGNAEWWILLGVGTWVYNYYYPAGGWVSVIITPAIEAWIEGLSSSSLFLLISSALYLSLTAVVSLVLLVDVIRTRRVRGGQESQNDPPHFSVDLVDKPMLKWKKWPEHSLRPLEQDIVLSTFDTLALVARMNIRSTSEREVEEVTLNLLNTGWNDIPDNWPRLQKVSTGEFAVSFDLVLHIDPAIYHVKLTVKLLGERSRVFRSLLKSLR